MAERGGLPNVNPLVKGGGFLYFIQERVKQLKAEKGVDLQGMGLTYQIDKFDPEWKAMPHVQQRYYRDLARNMKKTDGYKRKKFNQGRKKKRDKSPSDDEDDYLGDDDFYPPGNAAVESQRQADHSQFEGNHSGAESSPFPSATAAWPPSSRVEVADGSVNSTEQWDNQECHFVRPVCPLVGSIPTFPNSKGPQPTWIQLKSLQSDSFQDSNGKFHQYHDAASVDDQEEHLSHTGFRLTSPPPFQPAQQYSHSQESQYYGDQLGEYDCPPAYYGVPNTAAPVETVDKVNESVKNLSILKSDSFESISRGELLSGSMGTPFGPVESQLDLDKMNIDDFHYQPSSTPCLNPIENPPDEPFEQQPEMFNFQPRMVEANADAEGLERGAMAKEPEQIRPKRKIPALLKNKCVAYPKELDMSTEVVEPEGEYAVEGFGKFWARMPDYVKSDEMIDSLWDELEKFTEDDSKFNNDKFHLIPAEDLVYESVTPHRTEAQIAAATKLGIQATRKRLHMFLNPPGITLGPPMGERETSALTERDEFCRPILGLGGIGRGKTSDNSTTSVPGQWENPSRQGNITPPPGFD